MASPIFALKEYQEQTLEAFADYLKEAVRQDDPDTAFYQRTRISYNPPPALGRAPFICLRVPTGGGKTVLAAHAIPLAADLYMRTDQPTVIWFTPSQTIRDQTLQTLRDRSHPNRRALSARYGENVRIMDNDEALYARRGDYDGGAVIIVSTIQAFRIDKKEGRKVYEANGELMDHFSGLTDEGRKRLARGTGGEIIPSLANVFRLRRPMIVADEAHNMSTELSFDTLGGLDPQLLLEFTATPTTAKEHNPKLGKYASNVLHHVSAAELKAADMIKLPVILTGRSDPKETLADAIGGLERLADTAREEQKVTGEFVRPVMLLQAQAKSKDSETLHAEALKALLIDDFHVPAEHIALATGDAREIDGVDLKAPDCKIRFIITQQALREGWDCAFAYVLCSVANQRSERAVEQLLGRILRLPNTKRKHHEALNSAFAFATTTDFREAASLLKDGLVANGFEAVEAETLVRTPQAIPGLEEGGSAFVYEEPLPDGVDAEAMVSVLENLFQGRVSVDPTRNVICARGTLSHYDRKHLILALPQVEKQIDALVLQSRTKSLVPRSDDAVYVAFKIPALCVRRNNQLEMFDKAHYLDSPWDLETYDPNAILEPFRPVPNAEAATIDITDTGKIEIDFDDDVPLLNDVVEHNWTLPMLINWLNYKIPENQRTDITHTSSRLFIAKALDVIMRSQKLDIGQLARAKFRILSAVIKVIGRHRQVREADSWNSALISQSGLDFATNGDVNFHFDSRDDRAYSYNNPYSGQPFKKHLYPVVGDLASQGEEYECAVYLDHHKAVKAWLRNTDRKANSFWLQSVPHKFYPDFLAVLEDGRILVVEYKGKDRVTNDDSKEKKLVGDLWADRSGGQCLFLMITDKQFGLIDQAIRG